MNLKHILFILTLAIYSPAISQNTLFEFGQRKHFDKPIVGNNAAEPLR